MMKSVLVPLLEHLRHRGDTFGMLGGEIRGFGAILCQVEKLPLTLRFGDELPVRHSHGLVTAGGPAEAFVTVALFPLQDWKQRFSGNGCHDSIVETRGIGLACDIEDRRRDVGDVTDLGHDLPRFHNTRPPCDERRGNAAFVVRLLVIAEGRV